MPKEELVQAVLKALQSLVDLDPRSEIGQANRAACTQLISNLENVDLQNPVVISAIVRAFKEAGNTRQETFSGRGGAVPRTTDEQEPGLKIKQAIGFAKKNVPVILPAPINMQNNLREAARGFADLRRSLMITLENDLFKSFQGTNPLQDEQLAGVLQAIKKVTESFDEILQRYLKSIYVDDLNTLDPSKKDQLIKKLQPIRDGFRMAFMLANQDNTSAVPNIPSKEDIERLIGTVKRSEIGFGTTHGRLAAALEGSYLQIKKPKNDISGYLELLGDLRPPPLIKSSLDSSASSIDSDAAIENERAFGSFDESKVPDHLMEDIREVIRGKIDFINQKIDGLNEYPDFKETIVGICNKLLKESVKPLNAAPFDLKNEPDIKAIFTKIFALIGHEESEKFIAQMPKQMHKDFRNCLTESMDPTDGANKYRSHGNRA